MPQKDSGAVRGKESPERAISPRSATFIEFYWEAYNQIVKPMSFDTYLVDKWLPELGPIGFAIVKYLRRKCFHDREEGILRDEVKELRMGDIAAAIGVSEDTVSREFKRNETLSWFVRPIVQYKEVNKRPRRIANSYQVSMDTPIHPDDMERYENLRSSKEADRCQEQGKGYRYFREESNKPQNAGNSDSYKPQNAETLPQNAGAINKPQNAGAIEDFLPSGGIYTSSYAEGGIPPINPPRGKGEDAAIVQRPTPKDGLVGVDGELLTVEPAPLTEAERLGEVWSKVVTVLETLVERRRILTYFGEGRIQLTGLDETTATFSGATMLVDSARGKFTDALQAAFERAGYGAVEVRFTTGGIA